MEVIERERIKKKDWVFPDKEKDSNFYTALLPLLSLLFSFLTLHPTPHISFVFLVCRIFPTSKLIGEKERND